MKEKLKFILSFVLIRFRKSFDLLSAPAHFFRIFSRYTYSQLWLGGYLAKMPEMVIILWSCCFSCQEESWAIAVYNLP